MPGLVADRIGASAADFADGLDATGELLTGQADWLPAPEFSLSGYMALRPDTLLVKSAVQTVQDYTHASSQVWLNLFHPCGTAEGLADAWLPQAITGA